MTPSIVQCMCQNPQLIGSSIRRHLDPHKNHPDALLWRALEEVQMKEKVKAIPGELYADVSQELFLAFMIFLVSICGFSFLAYLMHTFLSPNAPTPSWHLLLIMDLLLRLPALRFQQVSWYIEYLDRTPLKFFLHVHYHCFHQKHFTW